VMERGEKVFADHTRRRRRAVAVLRVASQHPAQYCGCFSSCKLGAGRIPPRRGRGAPVETPRSCGSAQRDEPGMCPPTRRRQGVKRSSRTKQWAVALSDGCLAGNWKRRHRCGRLCTRLIGRRDGANPDPVGGDVNMLPPSSEQLGALARGAKDTDWRRRPVQAVVLDGSAPGRGGEAVQETRRNAALHVSAWTSVFPSGWRFSQDVTSSDNQPLHATCARGGRCVRHGGTEDASR